MKVKISGEVEMPEGWEFVDIRRAGIGDAMLVKGRAYESTNGSNADVVIIRRIQQWRPATIIDLNDAPLTARFKDCGEPVWTKPLRLIGYRVLSDGQGVWISYGGANWDQCEVLTKE